MRKGGKLAKRAVRVAGPRRSRAGLNTSGRVSGADQRSMSAAKGTCGRAGVVAGLAYCHSLWSRPIGCYGRRRVPTVTSGIRAGGGSRVGEAAGWEEAASFVSVN